MKKFIAKIGLSGIGLIIHTGLNSLFIFYVTPKVMNQLGFVTALPILYIINLIKVVLMIYLYDRLETDIFFIELMKGFGSKFRLKVLFFTLTLKNGRHPLSLSGILLFDQTWGMIFIRSKEPHFYEGIPKRFWWVLFASVFVATLAIMLGIQEWFDSVKTFFIKHFWLLINHLDSFLTQLFFG